MRYETILVTTFWLFDDWRSFEVRSVETRRTHVTEQYKTQTMVDVCDAGSERDTHA